MEKRQALELMTDLAAMSSSAQSTQPAVLLRLIYTEQKAQMELLGETNLDWIEFSRQVGVNITHFCL